MYHCPKMATFFPNPEAPGIHQNLKLECVRRKAKKTLLSMYLDMFKLYRFLLFQTSLMHTKAFERVCPASFICCLVWRTQPAFLSWNHPSFTAQTHRITDTRSHQWLLSAVPALFFYYLLGENTDSKKGCGFISGRSWLLARRGMQENIRDGAATVRSRGKFNPSGPFDSLVPDKVLKSQMHAHSQTPGTWCADSKSTHSRYGSLNIPDLFRHTFIDEK